MNNQNDKIRDLSLAQILKLKEMGEPRNQMKPVTIRLPASIHDDMAILSSRLNVSNSMIGRSAIEIGVACMIEQANDDEALKDWECE